jgi:hypothetical protein
MIGDASVHEFFGSWQERVETGQCRLIAADDIAVFVESQSRSDSLDRVRGLVAEALEPVLCPWQRFAIAYRDRPYDAEFVIVGDLWEQYEVDAQHPDYPRCHLVAMQAFHGIPGLVWTPLGTIGFYNFARVEEHEGSMRAREPMRECAMNVMLHEFEADDLARLRASMWDADKHLLIRCAVVASAVIAFGSARNSRLEEVPLSRAERRRRDTPPGIRFSRIMIDPMRTYRPSQVRGNDPALGTPWHLVRGHWAVYSEQRPLFGRPGLHGRFWVSEHERGDREHGEVVKDYTVLPPRVEHTGEGER